MCSSLIMPADYEMLISHSPPVFSHSPPTGYLSDYPPMRFSAEAFSRMPRSSCRSTSPSTFTRSLSLPRIPPERIMPALGPRRPCLVVRTDDTQHSSSDEDPASPPPRHKKRVVFADAKGMSLTHVRIMSESSSEPPLWSIPFLSRVTHGMSAEPVVKDEWEITFMQPASDYIKFRHKIDLNKVSLENVILKEAEELIVGTVKVSNLAFEKEVFVRMSADHWLSHEDSFCKYVPSAAGNKITAAYVLYDTFSFKIPMKPNAKRIEFCVGFRCEQSEYWDNNDGKNYVIARKMRARSTKRCPSDVDERNDSNNNGVNALTNQLAIIKCNDALQAKLESWSEFASWTHLDNHNPYW